MYPITSLLKSVAGGTSGASDPLADLFSAQDILTALSGGGLGGTSLAPATDLLGAVTAGAPGVAGPQAGVTDVLANLGSLGNGLPVGTEALAPVTSALGGTGAGSLLTPVNELLGSATGVLGSATHADPTAALAPVTSSTAGLNPVTHLVGGLLG